MPTQRNAARQPAIPVVKNGRTTGTTFGWISSLKSLAGDSGSAVLSKGRGNTYGDDLAAAVAAAEVGAEGAFYPQGSSTQGRSRGPTVTPRVDVKGWRNLAMLRFTVGSRGRSLTQPDRLVIHSKLGRAENGGHEMVGNGLGSGELGRTLIMATRAGLSLRSDLAVARTYR